MTGLEVVGLIALLLSAAVVIIITFDFIGKCLNYEKQIRSLMTDKASIDGYNYLSNRVFYLEEQSRKLEKQLEPKTGKKLQTSRRKK